MKRARAAQGQQPKISNFFAAKTGAQQQHEDEVPKKKQKQGSDDCVIVLDDADDSPGQGGAAAAAAAAGTPVQAKSVPVPALPTERDAAAHGMAQAKLVVTARTVSTDFGGPAEEQQQVHGRAAGRQPSAPKYTPLVSACTHQLRIYQ
jgi:hypothetical protein